MKLSVHLVHQGRYIKAGDPLPLDFELPSHLEAFAVYDDDPPQISRADLRLSRAGSLSHARVFGAETRLAKPATEDYPGSEEEFIPQTRGAKMGEEIRRAHQERK